jgi:hypothetical protein
LEEERISLLEIKPWFDHAGAGSYKLEGWDKEHFNGWCSKNLTIKMQVDNFLHKRWCGAVKITHDEKKRELLFKNHT